MSDKAYKQSLAVLSVFSVIILILGTFFCFFTPESQNKNLSESVNTQINETITLPPIVETTDAESFDSLFSTVTRLKYRYPDLLGLYNAGYSENGRELLMLTLGMGAEKALVIGGIHAREHITTKYLLKVIEDYCFAYYSASGYLESYNIYELLSKYTIYIIPCVNPDGLEIIRGRQNVKSSVRISKLDEYKANANGVDLNRNFPLAWESINNGVFAPADYYFKGYESASEAESRALISLCKNNDFKFMLSIHIKGNCIFWGDNHNIQNNGLYKAFATDIATPCRLYLPEPTKKAKDYGGGFENWFRHTFNRPGICIELSENQNKILPLGNENYDNFSNFVNYTLTYKALAAAMASQNK